MYCTALPCFQLRTILVRLLTQMGVICRKSEKASCRYGWSLDFVERPVHARIVETYERPFRKRVLMSGKHFSVAVGNVAVITHALLTLKREKTLHLKSNLSAICNRIYRSIAHVALRDSLQNSDKQLWLGSLSRFETRMATRGRKSNAPNNRYHLFFHLARQNDIHEKAL